MKLYTTQRFKPNPKFIDINEESFDGIIDFGDVLVCIECKGGFLSLSSKYSISLDQLNKEINNKMGKATKQLSNKIKQVFPLIGKSREIEFINPKIHKKILPLILIQEEYFKFPFCVNQLKEKFRSEIEDYIKSPDCPIKVHDVCVLTIEDLEFLTPYIESGLSLLEILSEIQKDTLPNLSSFKQNFLLFLKERKINEIKDLNTDNNFNQIIDDCSRYFNLEKT